MPSNKSTLNVSLASLHLINGNQEMTRISCTLKVTQQGTLVPQPYCSPETPHVADSLLQRSFTTTTMSEKNVVVATAGPTLTSTQVALIAMGIVACSSFVLAVYIWSRSLLNQRRERALDDATPPPTTTAAAEERLYRQQHYAHDYARSTIHDTFPLQQPAYTNNTAYFTHNGLPLPPTYKFKS
ncbi:unnamed protein product [Mucor fragilis]